jgi:hypothetical protein
MDRVSLEVVAEAEIPQHLEKSVVISGSTHVVDVAGAQTLLASGGSREFELDLSQEMIFELVHARGREKHRRIPGRNQHVARLADVSLGLEKGEILLPEFVGLHGAWAFSMENR